MHWFLVACYDGFGRPPSQAAAIHQPPPIGGGVLIVVFVVLTPKKIVDDGKEGERSLLCGVRAQSRGTLLELHKKNSSRRSEKRGNFDRSIKRR